MAIDVRKPENARVSDLGNGPYLAKVVSHIDPAFMAGLEVTLLKDQGNQIGDDNQTYTVKYLTPFYGSTAYEFMGQNKENDQAFNDTQKSYGMWFQPPDVGVTVMVVFINGDPADGYYIGCVPGRFTNHMIPAIGGTTTVDITADDKKKYATSQPLPVAEVNRRANDLSNSTAVDKIKKPLHPIAERFLEQGTLEDDVRGVTTSTVRRNIPNMVFGISTPGPVDKREGSKKEYVGRKDSKSPAPIFVGRLGGTQLVMDDGDDRYQRKKAASEGPVDYADVLNGESGRPDIPYNEYFRVRTRTGHQILMHNSEDLIYIGNARGTTWIELTSNGKIDIYAKDSISIHTENDFNFRADRDINLEAGRNVNIKATADYSKGADKDDKGFDSGRIHIDSKHDYKLVIGANGHITTAQNFNLATTLANYLTAGGNTNILSGGTHFETASTIHMNGPAATPATPSLSLTTKDNIVTDNSLSWAEKKYISDEPLKSIMARVPMHEPWPLHENQAPQFVTPEFTDRES